MAEDSLPKYWKGRVTGTNRGILVSRFDCKNDSVKMEGLFQDQYFGPTKLFYKGTKTGNEMVLMLEEIKGSGPEHPLIGEAKLKYFPDQNKIEGKWESDVGTNGNLIAYSKDWQSWKWWLEKSLFNLEYFSINKNSKALYILFLFFVGILALFVNLNLSFPIFIFLLIPSIFLFGNKFLRIIIDLGITKLGPIEREQGPTPEGMQNLITQETQRVISYIALDQFFVLNTQRVLFHIFQVVGKSFEDFVSSAESFGIKKTNIESTLQALQQTNCVQVENGQIKITAFGKDYINYLINKTRE